MNILQSIVFCLSCSVHNLVQRSIILHNLGHGQHLWLSLSRIEPHHRSPSYHLHWLVDYAFRRRFGTLIQPKGLNIDGGNVTILFTFCCDSLFSLIFLIILYLLYSIPRTFHLLLLFFPLFYIYFTQPQGHCLIILTHWLTHPRLSLYISSYALCTI